MNPPGNVEDLKNYILREIPKTLFMNFGLPYENDKGKYVVLNDPRWGQTTPQMLHLDCFWIFW